MLPVPGGGGGTGRSFRELWGPNPFIPGSSVPPDRDSTAGHCQWTTVTQADHPAAAYCPLPLGE